MLDLGTGWDRQRVRKANCRGRARRIGLVVAGRTARVWCHGDELATRVHAVLFNAGQRRDPNPRVKYRDGRRRTGGLWIGRKVQRGRPDATHA